MVTMGTQQTKKARFNRHRSPSVLMARMNFESGENSFISSLLSLPLSTKYSIKPEDIFFKVKKQGPKERQKEADRGLSISL